jgi:small GTP-binding protein
VSYRGKVILCGDAKVGKSSLLGQYIENRFGEEYQPTIGANFSIKEINMDQIVDGLSIENPNLEKDIREGGFKLYFWDIGGQQDRLFANEYYFVGAHGAMVVFSLDNKDSFKNIDFWITKLNELSGDIPYVIVGNKSDIAREVTKEKIEKKLKELGAQYIETSAMFNENVELAFESISIQILNNLK